MVSLTDEDEKMLEDWEKEFADRYTEKDKAFMQVKNAAPIDPPVIHEWNFRNDRKGDRRSGGARDSWRGGGNNGWRGRGGHSWGGEGGRDSRRYRGHRDGNDGDRKGSKRSFNGRDGE